MDKDGYFLSHKPFSIKTGLNSLRKNVLKNLKTFPKIDEH